MQFADTNRIMRQTAQKFFPFQNLKFAVSRNCIVRYM